MNMNMNIGMNMNMNIPSSQYDPYYHGGVPPAAPTTVTSPRPPSSDPLIGHRPGPGTPYNPMNYYQAIAAASAASGMPPPPHPPPPEFPGMYYSQDAGLNSSPLNNTGSSSIHGKHRKGSGGNTSASNKDESSMERRLNLSKSVPSFSHRARKSSSSMSLSGNSKNQKR